MVVPTAKNAAPCKSPIEMSRGPSRRCRNVTGVQHPLPMSPWRTLGDQAAWCPSSPVTPFSNCGRFVKTSSTLQPNGLFRGCSSRAARVPAGSAVLSEVETWLAPSWCQKAAGSQCNRRSPVRSNRHTWRNAKSPAASSRQGTRLPLDHQRILAMVLALKRLWAYPWPLHLTIETLRRWSTFDA
jgi:hypothetical protein